MNDYNAGPRLNAPTGDVKRQAVASLRGYAYQLNAAALAWLGLADGQHLYLEVAEDFAIASREALAGVQVKDTAPSSTVTIRSTGVRKTIDSLVDLRTRNPGREVRLHYLTTSQIGVERALKDRIFDTSALDYWRRAAAGADVAPLREIIARLDLEPATHEYLNALSDTGYRDALLRKIHWTCGAPPSAALRADLEAGTIEFAARERRYSSDVARQAVPIILAHLLDTSVKADERHVRRADLLDLIDGVGRISISREHHEVLMRSVAGGASAFERPSLIADERDLPLPAPLAPRAQLVAELEAVRQSAGVVITTGATGLGKTLTARLVARREGGRWGIIEFRNLAATDIAARLDRVIAEVVTAPATSLILDDLNALDDPNVRDRTSRLLDLLRRRDATALITCHRAPADTTQAYLSSSTGLVVEGTYLSEDEVASLVSQAGGDPKYAAPLFRATARGHPQLTMAAILHLRATGWARSALAAILSGGLQVELEAERRAARDRLVAALPPEAQTLLFRTSIVAGRFDRDLALALGGADPLIANSGIALDKLVGPWIEPVQGKRLRISPLVEGAGREIFSPAECTRLHALIAETMMRRRLISPVDADMIMTHALAGGDGALVVGFAGSVVGASAGDLEMIAPFLPTLVALDMDGPIFPAEPAASAMMRLGQLMLLTAIGAAELAQKCWQALDAERVALKGEDLFEGLALSKLLLQERTGELFPDWLELLLRFDALVASEPRLAETAAGFQSRAGGDPHVTGVLFANLMRGITTVAGFRRLLERLDGVAPDLRERLFSSFQPGRGDIQILVTHGWLKEARTEGFDWQRAATNYAVCSDLAARWNDQRLAIRCAIAQAICLDENGGEPDRALGVLGAAETRFGRDVALSRARAKVHWRRRDHAAALPLLQEAADIGGQDPLEQAFIAREAAISAADLGDWAAAQAWFLKARDAAQCLPTPTVRATCTGLVADAAMAAVHGGRPAEAIPLFREALSSLPSLDPDGTLQEAYAHRIVRHGIACFLDIVCDEIDLSAQDFRWDPGTGSNSEPKEEIRSHPLGALDLAFYLLVRVDEALGTPTGYAKSYRRDLVEGPIRPQEAFLIFASASEAVICHRTADFAAIVRGYAGAADFISSYRSNAAPEILAPVRGDIAPASLAPGCSDAAKRAAEDYLLSLSIHALLARDTVPLDEVVSITQGDPELEILKPLIDAMKGERTVIESVRDGVAVSLHSWRSELAARPDMLLWAGIWFLLHLRDTQFLKPLTAPVVDFIFEGWSQIVDHERFRLSSPTGTVPALSEALRRTRDRATAAALIIAAAPAAGVSLSGNVAAMLQQMSAASGTTNGAAR